ncbi:MAG: helix-turn-helix domain-containing protein [Streptosporangiaceae bacterium]
MRSQPVVGFHVTSVHSIPVPPAIPWLPFPASGLGHTPISSHTRAKSLPLNLYYHNRVVRPGRRRRADSQYTVQAARLALRLREIREQVGLTQEQLAARARVAVGTVRKIEQGAVIEPGYFTVMGLLNALGVTHEELRL